MFNKDLKSFFLGFSEPYYVKYEKLDILISLCEESNCDSVLTEIKEYISEPDPEFVRKVVKSLGDIVIRFENVKEK